MNFGDEIEAMYVDGHIFRLAFRYVFLRVFGIIIVLMLIVPFIFMLGLLVDIIGFLSLYQLGWFGQLLMLILIVVPSIAYWWFWICKLAGDYWT